LGRLLGIDTGGTYTDAVLFDETDGVVASAKSLTTKHDLALGVRGAVEAVLPRGGEDIRLVSLSTTLATNAIVEGQGAPVCLLLLGYGEDALERSGLGQVLHGDPVVFIAGGHDPMGDEQRPLDLEAARQAILAQAPKVAAFAVAGYFAVRNPGHELKVRDLARELTGLPVACAHELTSNLDAPRRALTAVLNARLIPQLQQLILAVRGLLAEKEISAPLMVVKGDGSLITDAVALTCPVETILSGPAASVVGARYLSGEADIIVSDIGGTTTDVAVLHDGRPLLNREGATVGGWRTMVEAVAVHTFGLGGDSEIRLDEPQGLVAGPRRVVPLSLLAAAHPQVTASLEAQVAREAVGDHDGRFALRSRPLDGSGLTPSEERLWRAMEAGPVALEELLPSSAMARPLARLVDRGLVVIGAFAPSDAAHVLGLQAGWPVEAARLGAALFARRGAEKKRLPAMGVEALARAVVERVVVQSGQAVVEAALAEEGELSGDDLRRLGRVFVGRAMTEGDGAAASLVGFSVTLKRPLAAIGAPAATYYPAVAERLGCRLVIPPHAAVSNAVGAVAGGVMQSVTALVTAPEEGRYRVHLASGVRDFTALSEADGYAETEALRLARSQAEAAGAATVEVELSRRERAAEVAGGKEIFVDREITATAFGRPRLAEG
jgi:N-methylhydantoinase A/oxoprolinase/acetone carboxylase beta subunit